jgi:hypothetical protein
VDRPISAKEEPLRPTADNFHVDINPHLYNTGETGASSNHEDRRRALNEVATFGQSIGFAWKRPHSR